MCVSRCYNDIRKAGPRDSGTPWAHRDGARSRNSPAKTQLCPGGNQRRGWEWSQAWVHGDTVRGSCVLDVRARHISGTADGRRPRPRWQCCCYLLHRLWSVVVLLWLECAIEQFNYSCQNSAPKNWKLCARNLHILCTVFVNSVQILHTFSCWFFHFNIISGIGVWLCLPLT